MQQIVCRFSGGKVKITTSGFAGKACRIATADLEKGFGKKTKDTPTAEMNKPATQQVKQS